MDFAPFLELPLLIKTHVICALLSIVIGPFAILRKRRDRLHKVSGYVWVVGMFAVATTGAFIPTFGIRIIWHLGPIHIFTVITFISLFFGMRAIFKRDIVAHKEWMSGLYWQGLLLAGLVNFFPGRMTNQTIFPGNPEYGYVAMALGGLALVWFRVARPQLQKRASARVGTAGV